MSKLLLLLLTTAGARERYSPCPNSCSGHGLCDAWHVCHCADTYQGADCSQRTCPYGPAWADHPEQITGDGVGHQPAECSRRGVCDRLGGTCVCGVGFEGAACERRACGPLLCTGRGVCRSLREKALRRDLGDSRSSLSHFHSADPPFSAPVQTYNAWDATMMHGCDCDPGFWGPNCEFVECPRGDDPYTSGSRVVQQMLVCMGDGGSVALSFRGATTRPLAWDSSSATVRAALLELPTLRGGAGDEAFGDQREMLPRPLNAQLTGRAVSVLYDNGATTLCAASGVTAVIQFNQDFGDIPLLVPDATDLTHSSIIISPSLAVALKQTSDKEDAVCSNRGLCDPLSGRCACDGEFWGSSDGYGMRGSRGDCGVAVNLASITGCPGDIPCNGHGVCDEETFACGCEEGWRAADCSERTCPYGPAWYAYPTATDVAHVNREECSGMGTCDRTLGVCFCQDGFSGAACDVLACPGETAPCSGHGQCLTMQQLAQANGFTYRSTPDDAYTWDADAVRGCRCDEGFRGYDCSLRFCPFGDDPLTTAVVDSKECSGRGLCDEMTGTCVCVEGFGSSDGKGRKGTIQDCGFKLPLSAPGKRRPRRSAAAPAPQVPDAAALPPARLKPPPPRTKGLKAPDAAPQAPAPPQPAPAPTASPAPAAPATRPPRWTPEEEARLRSLVAELGDNWPAIAERLGTGRTVGALETKWSKLEAAALRDLVPDAFPAPAPAPVRDEDKSDDEVMPTRKKRGYVTLSDRAPRPSAPLNESSSDDEVMPTKKRRGPPKKRN